MADQVTAIECRPFLADAQKASLRAGGLIELSGELLTIRDATARRLFDLHRTGAPLPVDFRGRVLYAVGPSPAKPGQTIGSAGPTTIERFTSYLPMLFDAGVSAVI